MIKLSSRVGMRKSVKNKSKDIKEPEVIKIGKYSFTPILANKKLDRVGYDMEDIALCTETIKQIDADPFMSKLKDIDDMKDRLYENPETGDYEDEIDEDEVDKLILNLIKSELEEKILEN